MPFSNYQQNQIGSALFTPNSPVIAGEYTEFELIYSAGYFGIDDSGSLKIVWRFASDMAKPQFDNPAAPNYVSIAASNAATLDYRFDVKNNIRPWGKTLSIKIVKGYFQKGDQLHIRFGDRRKNSPGIRMQTFCEDAFELKVLVDAFATCDYVELPQSPTLKIIPGKPFRWQAVVPTQRTLNANFNLNLKAEDIWGNPTAPDISSIQLIPNIPVKNLPKTIEWPAGEPVLLLENLQASQTGDLRIEIRDIQQKLLAITNPLRISEETKLQPFWGDMHGQSEETIGSNSIDDYFTFARDRAFLDASCHQGNDFQITNGFWNKLNQTTAAFNQPGKFVTFPGYEYSANTGLGGDHNVLFRTEGEQIHRSSHALIADKSDSATDR
ncbi:DUF3604 domain-containing protein, partial [bacterium]|nr:DUF3604 domain-containing protein [bacterium]